MREGRQGFVSRVLGIITCSPPVTHLLRRKKSCHGRQKFRRVGSRLLVASWVGFPPSSIFSSRSTLLLLSPAKGAPRCCATPGQEGTPRRQASRQCFLVEIDREIGTSLGIIRRQRLSPAPVQVGYFLRQHQHPKNASAVDPGGGGGGGALHRQPGHCVVRRRRIRWRLWRERRRFWRARRRFWRAWRRFWRERRRFWRARRRFWRARRQFWRPRRSRRLWRLTGALAPRDAKPDDDTCSLLATTDPPPPSPQFINYGAPYTHWSSRQSSSPSNFLFRLRSSSPASPVPSLLLGLVEWKPHTWPPTARYDLTCNYLVL
ncbi:uncharacterized protein LOC127008800 [Eriocheir sinensis]|uniref:uncharacterized protein LOC127008800 n=1 Tax=Eriocheir sinensis TaxID=95602 RepID=UPI0021CA2711|nr:uncharacterized protein LOC127008800 [Eriocheir sinensis]